MIAEGLWKPHKIKKEVVHQLRERRACFGERCRSMVHRMTGLKDDRKPACCWCSSMMRRGSWSSCASWKAKSFFSYCAAAEGYFRQYGKPGAFYSDKHSIFRVHTPGTGKTEALTQFGRAMQALDIQILCANSPQAKGRVERVNQTLQDRLVKESACATSPAWQKAMPTCLKFIGRFQICASAVEPRSSFNAHRP